MLKHADNELLTRVGPGTPMGNLLRQFWFPVLPSSELPEPGGRPVRMKLMGEQLVIFRSSEGKVGLLSEFCAHRGATLFYGRNEEGGLRCVYHGWKYGLDGRCQDMPNEPVGATFKDRIRQPAYPCREVNGVVWTYMGSRAEPPPLPDYGLATMPENQKLIRLSVRECNWVQALEGDLDLSHGAYLHSALKKEFLKQNHLDRYTGEKPHLEALDTPYGEMHAVRRTYDGESYHWGVGHFLFPFITNFPPVGDAARTVMGHVWVPMDDYNTFVWFYMWDPCDELLSRPAPPDPMYDHEWEDFRPATTEPMGRWRMRAGVDNDFGFNEEAQKTIRYSGLPTVDLQDQALQVGMGPIVNRGIEHLGTTDAPQIRVRRRLMAAAEQLRDEGVVPDCVDHPETFGVRAASGLLPKEEPWVEATREWVRDEVGKPVRSKGHVPAEQLQQLPVP
jgi:nitrite reductase/ring-hydroxylating ferredoxin subunit